MLHSLASINILEYAHMHGGCLLVVVPLSMAIKQVGNHCLATPLSYMQEPLVTTVLGAIVKGSLVLLQSNSGPVIEVMVNTFMAGCPHNSVQSLSIVAPESCDSSTTPVYGEPDTESHVNKMHRNPFGVMSETEAATVSTGKEVHRVLLRAS